MHIFRTLLYTFSKVLTKRICSTIKSLFSWWSFSLFLWSSRMIQLYTGRSEGLNGEGTRTNTEHLVDNVLKVGVRDLNLTLGGVIVLCFWARLFSLGPSFQVAGSNDTKLVMTWHRLMLYPVEESQYSLSKFEISWTRNQSNFAFYRKWRRRSCKSLNSFWDI